MVCEEVCALFRTFDKEVKQGIATIMDAPSSESDYDMQHAPWDDCELGDIEAEYQQLWDAEGPGT